jgi:hypothetical protein
MIGTVQLGISYAYVYGKAEGTICSLSTEMKILTKNLN